MTCILSMWKLALCAPWIMSVLISAHMAAMSSFVRVADGVVYLRLEGSCHGCPSSTITMKLAVEKAIEEAAPEV